MAPLDESPDDWQQRILRFRKFAALLGANETTAPLRGLAQEMERHLLERRALRGRFEELKRLHDVMIAEIDVMLAYIRSAKLERISGFSAADLREESQLCREEARAALDAATQRAFARRAFDFAMLGEQRARAKDA